MMTETNYSSSDLVFRLVDGAQQGTLFPVSTQKCLLGKSYDESGAENGHCAILRGPTGASIKSFGTEVIVNGQPIESQWLNEGDQIEIGAAKLEVVQIGNYTIPNAEVAVDTKPQPTPASTCETQHQQPSSEPVSEEPESHQPESHQPESQEPESQEPESHQPESHQPESREPVTHEPEMARPTPPAESFQDPAGQDESIAERNFDQFHELNSTMDQMSADVSCLSSIEGSDASNTEQARELTDPVVESSEFNKGQTETTDRAATSGQAESIYSPLSPPEAFDPPEPIQKPDSRSFSTGQPIVESEALAQELKLEKAFASFDAPSAPIDAVRHDVEECTDSLVGVASKCETELDVTATESSQGYEVSGDVEQNQPRNEADLSAEARLREVFTKHLHEHADEIVYDAEEDNTTESEPVENETVSQLLARMQEKGQLHGYKADDDDVAFQNAKPEDFISHVEPTDSVQPSQPSNSHAATMVEDDDASVQDYMNRLLGRMGPAVAPVSTAPVENVIEHAPQSHVKSLADEPVDLLTPSEYKPSKRPPEASKNLDAMRELANQTNRVAIQKSRSQQAKAFAITNFGLMALGLALGGYLVYNATGTTDSLMWLGGAVLGISLFLGGAGAKAILPKKDSE